MTSLASATDIHPVKSSSLPFKLAIALTLAGRTGLADRREPYNLIALTAVLYICSLMNFAAVIADYNVSHSREPGGKGIQIDTNYLSQLGPQALPAIERALQTRVFDPFLVSRRDSLVEEQRKDMASWRSWGFRSWRLQRYLDARQNSAATN